MNCTNGNLLTVTDAKNQTTTYTYDEMDRLKAKKMGVGSLFRWHESLECDGCHDSVRGGRVARVGFTGRGGRRRASLSGRGSRSRFLVEIDDGGGKGAVLRQDCEGQRCEHENESCHDRKLAEKVCRTSAAEDRLTRPAERGADFRALARLKENGADHERAHDDMDDDEQGIHNYRGEI